LLFKFLILGNFWMHIIYHSPSIHKPGLLLDFSNYACVVSWLQNWHMLFTWPWWLTCVGRELLQLCSIVAPWLVTMVQCRTRGLLWVVTIRKYYWHSLLSRSMIMIHYSPQLMCFRSPWNRFWKFMVVLMLDFLNPLLLATIFWPRL